MDESKIKKLKEKMRSVPFGNSVFQNLNFTAGKEGQARRYRHALLQINQKLNALQECKFRRRRLEIDLAEIDERLQSAIGFDRDRLIVDREEKEYQLDNEIKLIEDAVIELRTYEWAIRDIPDMTREEFEAGEHDYWKARLTAAAMREIKSIGTVSVGTAESLENMGIELRIEGDKVIAYDHETAVRLLPEEIIPALGSWGSEESA